MQQQIEPEQVYAASSRASMSLRESHNFETIFHIPATHRTALYWFDPEAKAVRLLPLTGSIMSMPQTGRW
jgi:hypothetical protein